CFTLDYKDSDQGEETHKLFFIRFATPAEVMKASQQAIERGVKDCLFIDYKRRSGHFDVTTVASIKEITDKVFITSFTFCLSFIRNRVASICP
ncbi:hypothetical protein GOODEAATRI_015709, partial [Goodea atripinnis]